MSSVFYWFDMSAGFNKLFVDLIHLVVFIYQTKVNYIVVVQMEFMDGVH